MAGLNAHYGSELHLLRLLGRHREFFNRKVLAATGAEGIEWRDFPSGEVRAFDKKKRPTWDWEWDHLNFLGKGDAALEAWAQDWPSDRTGPHWDAIARLSFGDDDHEWLLVEAKANLEELSSSCGAKTSLSRIKGTLDKLKSDLGVAPSCDWINGYYQYCNRLAVLDVMNRAGSAARLAYIYFYGDVGDKRRTCPASPSEWDDALRQQDAHVGLPQRHRLSQRIHRLFVDARIRTPKSAKRGKPVAYYVEDGQKKDSEFWKGILEED